MGIKGQCLLTKQQVIDYFATDSKPGCSTRMAKYFGISRWSVLHACSIHQVPIPALRKKLTEEEKSIGYNQRTRNKEGISPRARSHIKDPRKDLVSKAKLRAKQRGHEFDLYVSDITIPAICPVLGIPIKVATGSKGGFKDNAPSIDRVDNTRGYTWDNVLVVSFKANRLKNDAVMEELQSIVNFYTAYKAPSVRAPIEIVKPCSKEKLTEEQKTQVKQDYANIPGITLCKLSQKYDIGQNVLSRIIHDLPYRSSRGRKRK